MKKENQKFLSMMYQVEDVLESDGIMRSPHLHSATTAITTTSTALGIDDDSQSARSDDYHPNHTLPNDHHNRNNNNHSFNQKNQMNMNTNTIGPTNGGICSSFLCCITGSSGDNSSGSTTNSTIVTRCTILCLLCNTIVVIVLFVFVILMGLQLHTLQTQVGQDEQDIATLQTQITTQINNQQHLNQRVDEEHSLTLYQMAGTFTLLTCLISVFHMTQHLSNYHEPIIQRKIIAILWMSPIYSVTSFLSLIFTNVDPYLAVIKDCYEAYTIYTFLSFLIAVLGRGNRTVAIQVLACHAHQLHKPNRCLSFLYYPHPETSPTAMATAVLTECQILAMQFVLVRPISSILTFVVDVLLKQNENDTDDISASSSSSDDGSYTSYFKSPNFYIAMITNISVFFAFQGLLKFYHAVHLDLKWCQPFNKFLTIKGIVFLTFWQGLLISILISVNNSNSHHETTISISPTTTVIGQPGPTPTLTPINPMYPVPAPFNYAPISATPQPLSSRTNDIAVPTTTTSNTSNRNSTRLNSLARFLDDPHTTSSNTDDEERDGEYGGATSSSSNSNNDGTNNDNNYDTKENLTNDNSSESNQEDNRNESSSQQQSTKERASHIQNFLICFEMLLFAIGHWCVFPVEEWKPDYRPPMNYAKPGFGISDFAQDISDIVGTATQRRRRRRRDYEPTSNTESTHSHNQSDRNNNDDDDQNGGEDGFSDGIPPNSVIQDEYDNDDGMDANGNIPDNSSPSNFVIDADDVVVTVPFGDVTIAPATTSYNDADNDDDLLHQQPQLRAIT